MRVLGERQKKRKTKFKNIKVVSILNAIVWCTRTLHKQKDSGEMLCLWRVFGVFVICLGIGVLLFGRKRERLVEEVGRR